VVQFTRKDLGLQLTVRGNFHDWKLSVSTERPLPYINFTGLFHTTPPVDPKYTGNELASVYFEGFPKDLVYGYYHDSRDGKWSACVDDSYTLYTVCFLVMRAAGGIKPHTWHTEASHRAELDAQAARRRAREAQEGVAK
jgi:hypothetical protein